MKIEWLDDSSKHRLVADDGRHTVWTHYTQISYLDGKVGATDYYTGKGEMILTPDEFCQMIATKERNPKALSSEDVPLWGIPYPKQEDCRIETPRECGCAFGQCQRGLIF